MTRVIKKKEETQISELKMTILSCNVCGNFNEVHLCKEANYKMVESSFGHQNATEDAEMSESEVTFRQEEEFDYDKFHKTEVIILPPDHDEHNIFEEFKELTRLRRLKNKKEKEEKAALEGEPVTGAKPTKTLKRKKEKEEKVAEPTIEAKTKKSKRKKEKNEDGDTAKPACTLYQKVCVEILTQMNELDIKQRPVEIAIQALYESTFFSGGNTEEIDAMAAMMGERPKKKKAQRDPDLLSSRTAVEYRPADDTKGRVYGGKLQNLHAGFRRLLCHPVYHDVDMVNSQPCLFAQVVTQAVGAEMTPAILNEYAFDRSGVFAKVRTHSGFENTTETRWVDLLLTCVLEQNARSYSHLKTFSRKMVTPLVF